MPRVISFVVATIFVVGGLWLIYSQLSAVARITIWLPLLGLSFVVIGAGWLIGDIILLFTRKKTDE